MTAVQVLVEIAKKHIMFRKSAHFVEVTIILQKNASKDKKKKRIKIARLIFYITEIRNVRLVNDLDVDLNII